MTATRDERPASTRRQEAGRTIEASERYGSVRHPECRPIHNEGVTPTWVPLLVAVVGFAGILLTQRAADRRAERDRIFAERREDKRASVEEAQRRLDWERNQRRDAHANFLAEQWRAEHQLTMYNQAGVGPKPAMDWTEPMGRQLGVVRIFGSPSAFEAGQALLRVTTEMESSAWGVGRYLDLDAARDRYIAAVQSDLGLGAEE